MMTTDDKLQEIERLLIDSIHEKAVNKEPLTSYEMQLVIKWTKATKAPVKQQCEPQVFSGTPLPFLGNESKLPFDDAVEMIEEMM